MTTLLQAENLAKSYGHHMVFADLSASVAPGDRLAVLGASGSGKSTLLRILAGLEQPTNGRIERTPGLRVGMVFQDLALWPNLNALDNVAMALTNLPRCDRYNTALAALNFCRVGELATRKPNALSIGQQQRVALARSIASRPQLLLLDEPFSSIDLLLREELMQEVKKTVDSIGAALIIVTHDPFEAIKLARNALVLEEGKLADAGNLRELMNAPKSRLLRHFAAQIAQLDTNSNASLLNHSPASKVLRDE